MSLVAPALGFAVFALLFGVIAARTLHAAPAVPGGTIVPGNVDGWTAADGHAMPGAQTRDTGSARRHHPLTWIVALASLLFLGGSRELLGLALRFRAVLALIAHALHVLRLFSRRQGPRRP
jgi:hypothetical protein